MPVPPIFSCGFRRGFKKFLYFDWYLEEPMVLPKMSIIGWIFLLPNES